MTGYFGTSWSLLKKKYVEGHTPSFILQCNFVTSACAWFNLQRNVTDTTDTLLIPTSFNMTFSPPLEYFCGYIFMQIPSKPLNHFRYPLVTQKWINVSSGQNIWFLGEFFHVYFCAAVHVYDKHTSECFCGCAGKSWFICACMCESLSSMLSHLLEVITDTLAYRLKQNSHSPAFSSWLRMTSSYYL